MQGLCVINTFIWIWSTFITHKISLLKLFWNKLSEYKGFVTFTTKDINDIEHLS